jgi:5-methylcytosine-specific restriction endonuclease McrA
LLEVVMKPFTPEHRARLSAAKKGRPLTPEHVAAIKAGYTPESRARANAALDGGRHGNPWSPETRAKQIAVRTGHRLTPEHRAKVSAAMMGRLVSSETRARLSAKLIGRTRPYEPVKGDCAYCLRPATAYDHVIPRGRPGWDDPENVVPACHRCNASKHNRTPEEWLAAGLMRD